jgi:hypothetical protein
MIDVSLPGRPPREGGLFLIFFKKGVTFRRDRSLIGSEILLLDG